MKIYDSNTQTIIETPYFCGYSYVNDPKPHLGFYEYVEPDCDVNNQTLGKIIIVNDIATNEIINFPSWEFIDLPIRIKVREKYLYKSKSALALQMLVSDIKSTTKRGTQFYRYGYFAFLYTDDFTLNEDGTITSKDANMILEQIHKKFEIGIRDEEEAIIETIQSNT